MQVLRRWGGAKPPSPSTPANSAYGFSQSLIKLQLHKLLQKLYSEQCAT